MRLTVFFEDPFWAGIFERIEDGKLSVCKVTFGAEPKDYEVREYVLEHYPKATAVEVSVAKPKAVPGCLGAEASIKLIRD